MKSKLMCECGHDIGHHQTDVGRCDSGMCECRKFHGVELDTSVEKQCIECGRTYQCSHPPTLKNKEGICNICIKNIEENYQTGIEKYLFGVSDNKLDQYAAMKLATEISVSGKKIKEIWEFYKAHHED